MADAYGAVVLAKSDDCILDDELMIKTLNSLCYNGKWSFDDKDKSYWSDQSQYPTVFPSGRIVDGEEEFCELTLADYSQLFWPCIKRGSITFGSASNEKSHYITFESLTIESDGCVSVLVKTIGTSPDWGSHTHSEEYSPFGEQ